MAQSVRKHMPDARTVICVTDRPPAGFDAIREGFDEYWTLDDLKPQIEALDRWVFRHDVMELATAAKPFVLHALLEREDCDGVLFFDPDCELHTSCEKVRRSVREHSISLTPHSCLPHEFEPWVFFELNQLKVGAFNLGFFGVRNDNEGRSFAAWWRHRLRNYCVIDEQRHLFTDQKWIDLVPSYFSSVNILRGSTYNVARWNTFQRKVSRADDGGVLVDGAPLDFIHYSGFFKTGEYVRGLYDRRSEPWCEDRDVLDELTRDYAKRLAPDQAREEFSAPWQYGFYDDGVEIPRSHRDAYRNQPELADAFPNPFRAGPDLRERIDSPLPSSQVAKKKRRPNLFKRIKRKVLPKA
ncbi:MAG: hypothetical protein AAGE80_14445 [Pseudomonadota bacterium]